MTEILKSIVANHGYVTNGDLPELAKQHPNLPLVIKWSCAPRGVYPASEVEQVIANVEKNNPNDYAREVFLSANQLDTLREVMA